MKKLTVLERLLALTLLPKEGSYTDLKLVREARENLSFTEEENKLLKFREENGSTMWNQFRTQEKEEEVEKDGKVELITKTELILEDGMPVITVGEVEIKLGLVAERKIQYALKKMDDEGKLTEQFMSLYEKFIEGE